MSRRRILYIILLLVSQQMLSAQSPVVDHPGEVLLSAEVLSHYNTYVPVEDCQNGVDDDGDGLIDCADGDCQVLDNGGFESVPTSTAPNSFVTFPQYPNFLGSWAAVNIDGEVFYESASRPAFEGHRYASLLQNAGANPKQAWNENTWQAGGYDRFLFIENTFPTSDYRMTFYHSADNRYGYLGDQTYVQVQSMDSDYYYDTLIATPGLFDWSMVDISFTTDDETNSVAILFSTVSTNNSSVLIDGLKFCGARVPEVAAVDDSVRVLKNASVNINVLQNDIDLPSEGLSLAVLASNEPVHGTVTVNPGGMITYVPAQGFVGNDAFMYEICNTNVEPQQCSSAVVNVSVYEIIPLPVDTFYLEIYEDQFSQVCESYFELTGVIISSTVCQDGANGNCTENIFPCIDYFPDHNYNGMDTICVILCDEDQCDTSIFIIEILPVNDKPQAEDDLAITTEDIPIVFDILENDFDPDNTLDLSGVTIQEEAEHGTVILGPQNEVTYVPDEGYSGPDTIVYMICDDGQPEMCDLAEVVIIVYPLSDTVWTTMEEDTEIPICIDTSLAGSHGFSPVNYLLNVSGDLQEMNAPCLVYDPATDYYGSDTVLMVSCAFGICDTTIHVLEILPVNDPPIAGDDVSQTGVNISIVIDAASNDADIHDHAAIDPTSISIVDPPLNGEAIPQGDGSILYLPDDNFTGTDQFTYLICDLGLPLPALCDTAIVEIVVGDGENIKCMIPEAFSPNGDGLYDEFTIECADYYSEMVLFIYDRFGNQVYQSESGYQNNWDGTSMNNNKPLREGTYYWVTRFNDGHTKDRAGYVLIWR